MIHARACKVFFPECGICGAPFAAQRPWARYCSEECRTAAHRVRGPAERNKHRGRIQAYAARHYDRHREEKLAEDAARYRKEHPDAQPYHPRQRREARSVPFDGTDVRRERLRLDLSQRQLAARLDIPEATLRAWELGTAKIRHPTIVRLALGKLHDLKEQ